MFLISAALGQVVESLHTTRTVTNLSVASYMLSMSIFTLWWSSFSETLGCRTVYLLSLHPQEIGRRQEPALVEMTCRLSCL